MTSWYRMFDSSPSGVMEIRPSAAAEWNAKYFGIFWTVNSFGGPRRIESLLHIDAWAIDMDEGTKAAMQAKLLASPLVPSLVVETKRGYQAYWRAKDAVASHWNAVVLDRLVPHFGADKNARDLARILRVPGFLHWKNLADPFLIREVWEYPSAYSERQVFERFPDLHREDRAAAEHKAAKKAHVFRDSDAFWDRVYQLDHETVLDRLSGHSLVGGERYSFRVCQSGNRNILVDGKGTSCFIDRNGRIGSLSGGGPTVFQWLKWLHVDSKDAIGWIKHEFPETVR